MANGVDTIPERSGTSIEQPTAIAGTRASGGALGAALRGAGAILMRRRPSAGIARGCDWRQEWRHERSLPEGTVLYKGTAGADVRPGEPGAYTWFTTDRSLARHFSTLRQEEREIEELDDASVPMVHEYVLEREIRLPLFRSEGELRRFCKRYGIGDEYAAKTRAGAIDAGLPGWVALDRYKKWGGDDILIGDVAALSYRRSFDERGDDIGRLDHGDAKTPGR